MRKSEHETPAIKNILMGSSCCGAAVMNPNSIMRMQVRSLAPFSGLRIQCCHELRFRLQMRLRSGIAVACDVGQQLQL